MSGGASYYQPPPSPQYPVGYNPEIDSVKSMLNIAGIFALIIGILMLLVGVIFTIISFGFGIIFAVIPIIWGIVDILIFVNCREINTMVDAGQYYQAKSKTLVWMIIGFIFGGLIPGILILIAYIKFDPLIRATQPAYYPPVPQQQYQQPPPPQYQQPPQY